MTKSMSKASMPAIPLAAFSNRMNSRVIANIVRILHVELFQACCEASKKDLAANDKARSEHLAKAFAKIGTKPVAQFLELKHNSLSINQSAAHKAGFDYRRTPDLEMRHVEAPSKGGRPPMERITKRQATRYEGGMVALRKLELGLSLALTNAAIEKQVNSFRKHYNLG